MAIDPDNKPWTREQIRRGRALASERRRGRPTLEHPKEVVTIRLDGEVLDYFRSQGDGYQTRINAVLRDFVAHQKVG
jgi:uncharacterized protein (DUF4415 family)